MSKQLTTKGPKGLTVHTGSSLMGVADNLSSIDIAIPSLMLMQSNSVFVEEDDNINAGDFLHSIDKEVWGCKDKKPVELVFCHMFKTQIVSDVTDTKKWVATNQWEESMENAEYEQVLDGRTLRFEKCYNYVCFKADEALEIPHPVTGEIMYTANPVVVKFKGGSLRNGKRLNNAFQTYARLNAPSWIVTFNLLANLDENDRGNKYWAYDFKKGKQTDNLQQKAAETLCRQFRTQVAKVIDEETTDEPRNVTQAPTIRTVKNHAPGATQEGNIV